jgi:hypothetical protein
MVANSIQPPSVPMGACRYTLLGLSIFDFMVAAGWATTQIQAEKGQLSASEPLRFVSSNPSCFHFTNSRAAFIILLVK